ncbi:hypothetical protein C0Q70_14944 [Pomacea canaliculata]|uniref:Uncharacterized protein n=1 Tax=Pomacea canaliculata TaxID=400727 RepID=A0A2T7NTG6_POMCA|nr:hypothetical protein C0Q70_14944 [Pomacea canaliculata]
MCSAVRAHARITKAGSVFVPGDPAGHHVQPVHVHVDGSYLVVLVSLRWSERGVTDCGLCPLLPVCGRAAKRTFQPQDYRVASLASSRVSFSPLRPFTFHIPCLSSFQIGVMVRMLIGFLNFCKLMEENTFFGPSTFKTTIALSSAIFLLLLTSHYEAPYGSPQRLYVVELTGTVLFDLIDVVEAVDVLFVKEAVESLNPTMEVAILVVASINLLLPTIPFVTLSITGFGQRRLSSLLVSAHKALVSVAINLPNLVIRLILWHGFSVGISVFVLKNIVVIVLTTYSFYEHKHDKYHQHKHEEREKSWEKQQLEMTAHHGRATMTPEDKPMEAGHASEGHDEKKAAAESDKHHCRVEAEEKTTPYHGKRRESVA